MTTRSSRISGTTATMLATHETDAHAYVHAYAVAAARGDILPAILRLAEMRRCGQVHERAALLRGVGPSCLAPVLDRACDLMARAAEPRLLRAAAAMRHAEIAPTHAARLAFLNAAADDLRVAASLDPRDPTTRGFITEVVHAQSSLAARLRAARIPHAA